jgi:hypothetical protein
VRASRSATSWRAGEALRLLALHRCPFTSTLSVQWSLVIAQVLGPRESAVWTAGHRARS